jgi:hypothetical protein
MPVGRLTPPRPDRAPRSPSSPHEEIVVVTGRFSQSEAGRDSLEPRKRFLIVDGVFWSETGDALRTGLMWVAVAYPRGREAEDSPNCRRRCLHDTRWPRDCPFLHIWQLTGCGMDARWVDPGRPLPRRRAAPRGASLRRGRPTANPDGTPGAKPTSRRAGHVLPVVDVVRGPGPRRQVRSAGELRARASAARPRPAGDTRSGRRGVGESERHHARASARTARYQARGSLLFRQRLSSSSDIRVTRTLSIRGQGSLCVHRVGAAGRPRAGRGSTLRRVT